MNKIFIILIVSINIFSQTFNLKEGWDLLGATEHITNLSSFKSSQCEKEIVVLRDGKFMNAKVINDIKKAEGFWTYSKKSCVVDTNKNNINPNQYEIKADIWADNWFAMYIKDTLIKEDSVSISTEKSFNSESFTFKTTLPITLSFILKDFKQNDTGLEYIGSNRQQIGDGGFIAQFKDNNTNKNLLSSNNSWKCTVIHKAPLNKECEKSQNPTNDCQSQIKQKPNNWKDDTYDTSSWNNASTYSKEDVRPKDGYERVQWSPESKFIWTGDLKLDNTILCKVTLSN